MLRHEKTLHIGCWGWGVSAYDAPAFWTFQISRWKAGIWNHWFFWVFLFKRFSINPKFTHFSIGGWPPPKKKCTTPVPPKFHQSHHRPAGLPLLALGTVLLLGASGTSGMICWCLALVRIGSAGGAMCSLCLLNQYVADIGYENCET